MNVNHRLNEIRNFMNEQEIEVCVVTNKDHQFYLSGFKAILYSRPILYLVEKETTNLIVPALEEAHAKSKANIDNIFPYYEHPEMAHEGVNPLGHLKSILYKYSKGSKVGVDFNSITAEHVEYIRELGFEIKDIGKKITEIRYIKDNEELRLIEESGELSQIAVEHSLKACRKGITEIEVDAEGSKALFQETTEIHPDSTLDLFVMSPSGIERTNMPHVFSNTRKIKNGDHIIHSRQVGLNGYRAELERTVFVGKPTKQQREAFQVAKEAQQVALDFIKPGVTAAQVDKVAREIIEREGFGKYAICRIGHGIGISAHENPYIRFDNDLVLKEDMVFAIEPGFYIPGVGGFRHSDTVILTSNGKKIITEYPRDIETLTI